MYNLSIENWLLHREDPEEQEILFLWRNRPSIIIGRFQNPWLECRLHEMEQNNISFARRQSGGGAVYHDEGNTNFTFITGKDGFSRTEKTNLIIKTLSELGIHANQGDRHDIYINGKKVSGSASKYTSGKVIHHGTLLINADLDALNKYLTTKHYKNGSISSKGIKSVRSQVTNLIDIQPSINHNIFCKTLINVLEEESKPTELEELKIEDLKNNPEIKDYYNKIRSWPWLYGSTPAFTIDKKDCTFTIKKGIITEINSQGFHLSPKSDLFRKYVNKPCNILFDGR